MGKKYEKGIDAVTGAAPTAKDANVTSKDEKSSKDVVGWLIDKLGTKR